MNETTRSYLTVTAFATIGGICVTILLTISGALAASTSKVDDKANIALQNIAGLNAQASAIETFMKDQKDYNIRVEKKLDEIIKAVK